MSETQKGSAGPVLLALLAVYVVWGSTYLAIRVSVETLPPLLMAGARFLLAGGVMFLWLRLRGAPNPAPREWASAAGMGVLMLALSNGPICVAEQWVASGLTAVMVASVPLWAALFAGAFGQWPGRREWIGLAVGAAGVVLLNLEADLRGSPLGAALLLFAPACWALGSVWSRTAPLPKGAMASAVEMIAGGAALLVASPAFGERLPAAPSGRSILAVLYLAAFGSIVGFSAYGFLLRNVRPALATSYAYVNPAVAVLLGMWILGERLGRYGIGGMALIIAAVALVAIRRSPAPSAAPALSPAPRAEPAAAPRT